MEKTVVAIKQSNVSLDEEIKFAKCSVLALDIAVRTCEQVRDQFEESGKESLARQYGITVDHLNQMKEGYEKYHQGLVAKSEEN